MNSRIFFCLLLPFYGFAFIHCNETAPPALSEKVLDPNPATTTYGTADQLKYRQDYEAAAQAYEQLLQQGNVTPEDSLHLLSQIAYCRLLLNRTEGLPEKLDMVDRIAARTPKFSGTLSAMHFYNRGRFYFLEKHPDSALLYTHRALKEFYQYFPEGHLRSAQALTLLGLIHLNDGNLTDSVYHYSLQANDLFLNHPELQDYDWENTYIMGFASRLIRAHERGEFYGRATLQQLEALPFENPWLESRAKNLVGQMVKKRADALSGTEPERLRTRKEELYAAADLDFRESISIAESYDDPELTTFYYHWIINTTRFADTTRFFQAMDRFQERFSDSPLGEAHYQRLLGYYHFGRRNYESCIRHYNAFLQIAATLSAEINYRVFADSYYCLRVAHRELGHFDRSAHFARQSFLLYNCAGQALDIHQPDAVLQLDSTNRNCLTISGFFAEGLLEKYRIENRTRDLILANTYFDFVRRHSFRAMLNKDEDAFLTFQLEAGGRAYAKAVDAAFEAWTIDRQDVWLDKAFSYMEHRKSYLLYRDMLKVDRNDEQLYSLSDSIRILQGQVNRALFSLSADQSSASGQAYSQQLVNVLNRLEARRTVRLDSFRLYQDGNQMKIRAVQGNLSEGQGMLSFYNSGDYFSGIYLDRDTVIFYRAGQDYGQIENAVRDFRNSIEREVRLDRNIYTQYLRSARTLYQALLGPVASRLSAIEQLLIIPDQILDPVAFEALLTRDVDSTRYSFRDLPYLLHQVKIVYTPSWKVYRQNKHRKQLDLSQASIGCWTTPELNSSNGLDIIEQSIRSSFRNRNYQVFSQSEGGKALFSTRHTDFTILHLLLHASSSKVNRYDNQIRFGREPTDVLYGFELYQEQFRSKLVVLASCESASGTPKAGEGTFSLARSFINSGVPEVVAARFLIPQTTTGPLLRLFYEQLGQGQSAPAALHLAKVNYLKSIAKERHAYPRFWSGMVVFN